MKILHIIGNTEIGGVAVVVYNYMRFINREEYHFDIASSEKRIGKIGEQLQQMGANIYYLPLKSEGIKKHRECLVSLLKNGNYDAVHVHSNSTSYVDLKIAQNEGVECRIAHSHSMGYCTSLRDCFVKHTGRVLNYIYATHLVGCGEKAGNEIFGKYAMLSRKGIVLYNAIDVEQFRFNPIIRNEIRKQLNIDDKYVVGMVGRFSAEKNHTFALDVANIVCRESKDITFVFVGEGDLYEKMRSLCDYYKLNDSILFLGTRSDVDRLYQAFDTCIMPSQFEGFPVVAIEALCSGLPIVLSNRITKELEFGEHVQYLPLEAEMWVNTIKEKKYNKNRENGVIEVKNHGLDIRDSVKVLERIYSKE